MNTILSFIMVVVVTAQAYIVPNALGGYGLGGGGLGYNGYNPVGFNEFAGGVAGGVASSVAQLSRPLGGYGGFGAPGLMGTPLSSGLLGAPGLGYGGGFPLTG